MSAREIDLNKLPSDAQTWVNKELIFTHGYGAVVSPVNVVTPEGMPIFFIKDIPPQSNSEIKIDKPEIYFGEMTKNPAIVKGNIQEFDYPVGDSNKLYILSGRCRSKYRFVFPQNTLCMEIFGYKLSCN